MHNYYVDRWQNGGIDHRDSRRNRRKNQNGMREGQTAGSVCVDVLTKFSKLPEKIENVRGIHLDVEHVIMGIN